MGAFMSDEAKCKSVLDVAPETVILAFDVVGWTETTDPKRVLEARTVREEIEKALGEKAKELHKKHTAGKEITQEDAIEVLKTIPKPIIDKQTSEATDRLKCAFQQSPVGVWLDRNSWVLYVVVPLIAVGAGAYMYSAKVGDQPASWAASMAKTKGSIKISKRGKIELGLEKVSFVPSKREISAAGYSELQLERVKVRFSIEGQLVDGALKKQGLGLSMRTKLTDNVGFHAGSMAYGSQGAWVGQSKLGLAFTGQGGAANTSLNLDFMGSYGDQNVLSQFPSAGPAGLSAMATFRLRF